VQSLWNDKEAAQFGDDLGLRVYTSRLLGRDKALVLHGGGNTSVKIDENNILGESETLLYVKGSGWDLETIDRPGFSPVRLKHLLRLAKLESLSDPQMVNELKTHMTVSSAPTPSVEAILHAVLPYKYVDHTHADAVVTVTNSPDGRRRIEDIYGNDVVIIPYIMPGFDLARLCAVEFEKQRGGKTIGMVLMNHGIFSFGETARESYQRMISLVTRAEHYLEAQGAWKLPAPSKAVTDSSLRLELARLRRSVSEVAGAPMILHTVRNANTLAFAGRDDIAAISQQGPATPDHVIRSKRVPLLGRNVQAFAVAYREDFAKHAPTAKEPKTMLDPAPRVILDPEFGICAIGRTAKDAHIVNDIYQHTIEIILRATRLGGYQALPAKDLFDMEYWDLEQAKLRKSGSPPVFTGEIALVTGAASGIGKACVASLLARGAAVVGLDRNPAIEKLHSRPDYLGLICDVTDAAALEAAIESAVVNYGGLDILILNAGVFPAGQTIAETDIGEWNSVLEVNLTSNLLLMRLVHPLLELAPNGGRVVVIGSKNVRAPGFGASAYSASKAALNQLMRIAAMEWAGDGIRINAVHPDAVFDTGIWTPEVIEARAKAYAMTVEQYKSRNLMKVEIKSSDVAELAAEMCGPLFAKTTAAQVPVDGGDARVI
jgi:rhamnose utilization protein RhaD (predicted bifunctional aldolase and dehydrogenase)/NAD(P)-dependent dehydrogenase (short-subunit alcohol dehydrogenase family)